MKKRVRKKDRTQSSSRKSGDVKTMPLIILAFIILFIIVVFDLVVFGRSASTAQLGIGMVIFFVGFVIRLKSQLELGKNFAYEVTTSKDQELVTHGIHSVLRHPMYTGLGLISIGLCISVQSWLGLLASIVILTPLGIYRIKVEERAMIQRFGKEYIHYMKNTKRIIPYIW